jgi:hypothetical protein
MQSKINTNNNSVAIRKALLGERCIWAEGGSAAGFERLLGIPGGSHEVQIAKLFESSVGLQVLYNRVDAYVGFTFQSARRDPDVRFSMFTYYRAALSLAYGRASREMTHLRLELGVSIGSSKYKIKQSTDSGVQASLIRSWTRRRNFMATARLSVLSEEPSQYLFGWIVLTSSRACRDQKTSRLYPKQPVSAIVEPQDHQ